MWKVKATTVTHLGRHWKPAVMLASEDETASPVHGDMTGPDDRT